MPLLIWSLCMTAWIATLCLVWVLVCLAFWYFDDERCELRATRRLRRRIERPEEHGLWGQRVTVTPQLVGEVFGDGRKLLCVSPIMFRPHHFVVRVGSGVDASDMDEDLLEVLALLLREGIQPHCLGVTREGYPRHPLSTQLEEFGR